ncbi:MAG: hypothetical protein GY906_19270 [bacterium]|nr:hypothetical protein [bacterium]
MQPILRQFRLYGHRGSSARVPENTLEAFRQALVEGANALELDIHRSADNHFVVIHDENGLRTAGEDQPVCTTNLSQIKRWDVGRGQGMTDHPHRVPLLQEVLEEFSGVPLSIDLKPNDPGIVSPLLDLLGRHKAERHVTLASFHERMIQAIRRFGYPGRTAFSRIEIACLRLLPTALARKWIKGQAMQTPRVAGPLRLDGTKILSRCRALGVRADYWVVNDPQTAQDLLSRGATGIMTDAPDQMADVIKANTSDNATNSETAKPLDPFEFQTDAQ